MPYPEIRVSAAAMILLAGCATPNIFTASQSNKPTAEQAAPSGPRPSSYTTSWSGNQARKAPLPDNAAPLAAIADRERRIQELLASGERSLNSADRRAARNAYEQVLQLAPGDASANYQLAIMDDEEGRFAEAEYHYINVLKQAPNDANVLASYGWSYFLQGRYDDSDRILREALRYEPNNRFALNNLGMVYGTRGDYDGALTIFRMAGSEADAQKALALLKQNAGNVQVAGEQFANVPVNPGVTTAGGAAGNSSNSRGGPGNADPEANGLQANTPQGRKLVEDYRRLKAESDKQQQENRARRAQKNISAPSPWSNNRQSDANSGQRDLGQANPVQDGAGGNVSLSGIPPFKGNAAALSPTNGRFGPNEAAYPGAAPSQANRPRQADPADFGSAGNASGVTGSIPPFKPNAQSYSGTQAVYEQTAAQRPEGRSRSPVITPSGESPTSRGRDVPTWNSLPRDDSYRGNPNGGYPNGGNGSVPAGRLGDWPRNNPQGSGPADQSFGNSAGQFNAGQTNAGQFNAGQPGGGNSQQDAQAAAAQLGLSAGMGGLGFPNPDWPSTTNGQMGNPGAGSSASGGNFPDGQIPPAGLNPFNGQNGNNSQPTGQQPAFGGQIQGAVPSAPSNGSLANGSPSNSQGTSLPPWPGRPLAAGSVPQAAVPSAQAMVYGAAGDSNLPNFYSRRPTISPAR